MGSRLRTLGRIAALGALALLMSACLKLDMELEVSSDNTVSGTVIFGVQKQLLELGGGSIEDVLGSDGPLPSDVPGVSVEDYEDDEFAGQQFTFDAVPIERFNEGEAGEQLRIEREGDVFHVSGVLDLAAASGASGLSGIDPGTFLQGAQLQIRITFPGEVTETNGEVSGTTVTWIPEVGERLELEATASAIGGGGDSNTTLFLIIGAVVVVLAIVVVIVLMQRRKKPAVAAAGADGTGATAPGAPLQSGEPTPPVGGEAPPPPPGTAAPPPPPPPDQG
ncbi:MAG: LppM family (lipo)protein [Actinomycetota bacterium]